MLVKLSAGDVPKVSHSPAPTPIAATKTIPSPSFTRMVEAGHSIHAAALAPYRLPGSGRQPANSRQAPGPAYLRVVGPSSSEREERST